MKKKTLLFTLALSAALLLCPAVPTQAANVTVITSCSSQSCSCVDSRTLKEILSNCNSVNAKTTKKILKQCDAQNCAAVDTQALKKILKNCKSLDSNTVKQILNQCKEAPSSEAPSTDLPVNEVPSTDAPSADASIQRVVDLVNEARASAGLSPVTLQADISAAAQVRAQEIVKTFSHTRPDGTSCFTALQQAGVTYLNAGENIAYGQLTAEEVMNGWMNSSGHRANILSTKFHKIGVGHYQVNGVHYWTQLFTN